MNISVRKKKTKLPVRAVKNKASGVKNKKKIMSKSEQIRNVQSFDELLDAKYGRAGAKARERFDKKAKYFIISEMLKDEYEAEYGVPAVGWEVAERDGGGWVGTETVRIADYWYVAEDRIGRGHRNRGEGRGRVGGVHSSKMAGFALQHSTCP